MTGPLYSAICLYYCVGFVVGFHKHNVFTQCILEFSITLMYLNSCLNPFVYCFRLPDIRAKVRQTLRQTLRMQSVCLYVAPN